MQEPQKDPTPAPPPAAEPAHNIFRPRGGPLGVFFAPRAVAVVGATERPGSVGRTVFRNLVGNPFGGAVFPVNPKRSSVLGVKAYPDVAAVPAPVDLAVIATPAATVPAVVGRCVAAGVRGAVVLSAGFRETGPAGADLERRVKEHLRPGGLRLVGPNSLGLMAPHTGFNATFAAGGARPGSVGLVSQSGALLAAVLDWSLRENVGFSAVASLGSMLDVGWGDLIDYLCDDPRTQSIVMYMESVGDAGAFLSAAREVTLRKPVIVLKAGRTEAAAQVAASHTGALTGSDEVLDAAFRRTGVLRVRSIAELFSTAGVLARQPRPQGPRLTILTNAGGPGVLATDALLAGGGALAGLAKETVAALNALLPPQWSHGNPIDIRGDAGPERYAGAVEVAARDPGGDGLLVILTPQAMTDPTRAAEQLARFARIGKPVLASWMGGATVAEGAAVLSRAGIPTFPYPETAVRAFLYLWRHTYNLRGLFETPHLSESAEDVDAGRARQVIDRALRAGRVLLTGSESAEILAAYRIPAAETRVAAGEDEAVRHADALGYPVVLKLHSETITHKTDVDGVRLGLPDAAAVRRAFREIESSVLEMAGPGHFAGVAVQPMVRPDGYELILGSSIDPQFGPVVLFGTGGRLVEVFRDRALALPPLNTTLARRLMEQTRIYAALQGVHGRRPVDLAALEQLLVQLGRLVVEQRRVKEIDVNPLLAAPDRLVALDARVVLHGPDVPDDQLPALAIRPYPVQYVAAATLKDGTAVTIRPVRPEDEPLLARFHETLSELSVYRRYLHALKLGQRVAHDRLSRLCFIDYNREMALVADRRGPDGRHEIVGIGRLIKEHATGQAEFALLVSDRVQGSGLGTELLRRLLQVARDEGVRRVFGDILADNHPMQRVCDRLGFRIGPAGPDRVVKAVIDL